MPWARTGNTSPYYTQTLEAIANHFNVPMETPWSKLPKKVQDVILFGSGGEPIAFTYDDGMRTYTTQALRRRHHQYRAPLEGDGQPMGARGDCRATRSDAPCEECAAIRLKPRRWR